MGWFADQMKNMAGSAIGGIGGGIVGTGLGLLGGIGAGRRIKKQEAAQRRLNEQAAQLNYDYGEKAANNAFERQMKMYERTYQDESPENRVQQLEDAGLSVGLMYGGGMSSGGMGQATTAPQGGGASGMQPGNAAQMEQNEINRQAIKLQQAKAISEIEVNQSIAEKNIADAEKTKGVDTELGRANISKITQEIENYKVQRTGQEIQNRINAISEEVSRATKNFNIEKAEYEANKLFYEVEILFEELEQATIETDIKKKTEDDVINKVKAELKNLAADALVKYAEANLKGSQKRLTERQVLEIGQLINLKTTEGKVKVSELGVRLMEIGVKLGNKDLDRIAGFINSLLGGGAIGAVGRIK